MNKNKVHIIFFLIFIMAFQWISQGITLLHFFTNQKQLTVLHCVNKDRPQLQCHGRCFLSKQLSELRQQEQSDYKQRTLYTLSTSIFSMLCLFYQDLQEFLIFQPVYIFQRWEYAVSWKYFLDFRLDYPPIYFSII